MKMHLILLALLLAPFQGVETASIQGRVLRAGTSEPIAGARVTVIRNNAAVRSGRVVATADDAGAFVLRDLEPGDYRLSFAARGYADQEYGQKLPHTEGKLIEVTSGQAIRDLVVRMVPGGSVEGRVRDAEDNLVAGVSVEVLRFGMTLEGKRELFVEAADTTNDRGEYRLFWLTPGSYYLRAGGAGSRSRIDFDSNSGGYKLDGNQVIEPFAATFYPNSTSAESATLLGIPPGADLKGIDFRVQRQRLFRIRGRVIDTRTGQPPAGASIAISGERFGTSPWPDHYNRATGTFELKNLRPGTYKVLAILSDADPVKARQYPDTGVPQPAGFATVRISDNDADDVVLRLLPPVSLSGRVVLETGEPLPSDIRIELQNPEGSPNGVFLPSWLNAPISAAGTFRIPQIVEGTYNIAVSDPMYFVKQARYAGADVAGSPLKFTGDASSTLEVVISSRVSRLSGTVTDSLLQPSAGAQVVLVPDNRRDNREFYYVATTDARGRYTLENIWPGDYKLFAWEAIEYSQWFDPNILKRYEPQAQPVQLGESNRKTLDLKHIPADAP